MMANILAGISEPTDLAQMRKAANPNTMRPPPPLSSKMSNSGFSNLCGVCSIDNKTFNIFAGWLSR